MTWLEAIPPLAIIVGAVAAMGSLPAMIHRRYYGKDKKVQRDTFSLLMERRDERIDADAQEPAKAKQ